MQTFRIITLGCKVNTYESQAMAIDLEQHGYIEAKENEPADIYIIHTCAVTNTAAFKSRQKIRQAIKANPEALVIAVGCYVQAAPEEIIKDEAIDLIIGNNKKKDIVNIVEEHIARTVIDINDTKGNIEYEELEIIKTQENTRAYIKIQDGCNQFCSYCIIPYVRGRIRSRKLDNIMQEVNSLASNGYKEVVLTGIHISSYGLDFQKEKVNGFKYEYLLEVIENISRVNGIERIRLGSLEPRIITDEFISRLSKIEKVCPHFHLSLQSGCDETLKRMNRKYTTEQFMNSCNILRKYYDNPSLTTDVIVGFAGETQEEFDTTYDFLSKVKFSQMHVFKYSIRKGTVAEKLPNQVNDDMKNKRSKKLIEMSEKNHCEYMDLFKNSKQLVLFEEKTTINNKEYYIGHNERYVKVAVQSNKTLDNEIISVNIIGQLTKDILEATLN